MKLYHGSNIEIETIDLTRGQRFKDFGQGFYTTPLIEQAELWAARISRTFGGAPTVTCYEFDLERAQRDNLNIKIFEEPTPEWALFVMANRDKNRSFQHDYDIVIGPVADDKMVRIFSMYKQNFINLDAVVNGLIYKNLNSQYFFSSENSLKYLRKL